LKSWQRRPEKVPSPVLIPSKHQSTHSAKVADMKVGKPKSKRVPVRLRHKIQKASASKQRKERKEAKKSPQWKSRLKKDPGIPNLFPYKDKILAEIEDSRRKKEEDALKRRELAKAQRLGTAVADSKEARNAEQDEDDEDEILGEVDDVEDDDDDDEGMDVESNANPMAALLASAQARAQTYTKDEAEEDDEDEEDDNDNGGIDLSAAKGKRSAIKSNQPTEPKRKALPKEALADPVKAVTTLIDRLQKTQDGVQQLLDYYQIPPLVTAGSDVTSRFLVDVARKRGRLGRGGVPNLHAAAYTVLGDLNEERLRLPALDEIKSTTTSTKTTIAAGSKSDVQIVTKMAEPFRIEGLFGDGAK
jgi:nuclear GTP-binding protein